MLPRPRLDAGWFRISARPAGLERLIKSKKQTHNILQREQKLEQKCRTAKLIVDVISFPILRDDHAAVWDRSHKNLTQML